MPVENSKFACPDNRPTQERDMTRPPGSVPPPIERRPKRRNRVLLRGIISFANGAHSFNCSIRDITDTGACVVIPDQNIPSRLYLINIRDRLVYDAHVIWNSGVEIGVTFNKTIPIDEIVDPAKSYLRYLWLSQAAH
jgi:hypothetical protein